MTANKTVTYYRGLPSDLVEEKTAKASVIRLENVTTKNLNRPLGRVYGENVTQVDGREVRRYWMRFEPHNTWDIWHERNQYVLLFIKNGLNYEMKFGYLKAEVNGGEHQVYNLCNPSSLTEVIYTINKDNIANLLGCIEVHWSSMPGTHYQTSVSDPAARTALKLGKRRKKPKIKDQDDKNPYKPERRLTLGEL